MNIGAERAVGEIERDDLMNGGVARQIQPIRPPTVRDHGDSATRRDRVISRSRQRVSCETRVTHLVYDVCTG